MDFARFTSAALEQTTKESSAPGAPAAAAPSVPQYTDEQLQKIAMMAADIADRRRAAREKISREKISRRKQVEDYVLEQIDKISAITALVHLHKNGVKISEELEQALPELADQAGTAREAIAQAVGDGDAAESDLLAALIEGASEDPEAASELAAEAGDDISPEEVDQVAAALAEAIMSDQAGEMETKESQDRRAALKAFGTKVSTITAATIQRRAEKLIEAAMQD